MVLAIFNIEVTFDGPQSQDGVTVLELKVRNKRMEG